MQSTAEQNASLSDHYRDAQAVMPPNQERNGMVNVNAVTDTGSHHHSQVQVHISPAAEPVIPAATLAHLHETRSLQSSPAGYVNTPLLHRAASGSSASSPMSHYTHSQGTSGQASALEGLSPYHNSDGNLLAPLSRRASPGPSRPKSLDGRISPRPPSRLGGQHQLLYNPEDYARPQGDTRLQLFVGNLPFRVRWQDLKDLFRQSGQVLRSDVALTQENRSKGFGTVLFAKEHEAYAAIEKFNGYTWQSRVLDVRVDQQDPTGSISMANANAQQIQHHAYQTHQAAMQNMANLVGIAQAQNMAANAMYQQATGNSPFPMFGQGAASSPWMAAANLKANALSNQGFSPYGGHPHVQQGNMMQPQHAFERRAASPYKPVQLGNDLANMSLRRQSTSTEGSSRPSLPQSGSASSLGPPRSDCPAASTSPSSRPGTSPATSNNGSLPAKSISPPPLHGFSEQRDSVSPTSARRPPPGSLGPMPPSIFAGMSQNSHLPHPPAAAAAAVAAGYSLDSEASEARPGSASRRGSSSYSGDAAVRIQHQLRQQHVPHYDEDSRPSSRQDGREQSAQSNAPMPGGLVNFYSQHRGVPAYGNQNQGALGPQGALEGDRNAGTPAYTNRHLFVRNIPFNCQWQDLKDLFRAAGQILRADIVLGPDGRSKGHGTVLFATPEDAINALQMFNGYEFQGRTLKVHFDKFVTGGTTMQALPYDMYQNQAFATGQPQYAPPVGMSQGFYQDQFMHQALQQANYANADMRRDSRWSFSGPGATFDDNASVPGTPIHELNLSQLASFPSPGFASPIQQQNTGQPPEVRGRGSVAPIGSGAPHTYFEGQARPQMGHALPLSPLTIQPMNMAMPSPGPGNMFSPHMHGMPMMTPSMPGFSFHPFPQTPPLMPHFLSPGLGPFSPPLMGTPGAFFGVNGPSSLRNTAPGDDDTTPLQSPKAPQGAAQESNYFPPTSVSDIDRAGTPKMHSSDVSASKAAVVPEDGAAMLISEKAGRGSEDTSDSHKERLPANIADQDGTQSTQAPRRASFKETKSTALLTVPTGSKDRGGSLDIPRPNLFLGDLSAADNGSALDEGDATPPAPDSIGNGSISPSGASQSKKSPWNLSWLKK